MVEGIMGVDTDREPHPTMHGNLAHEADIPDILPWTIERRPWRIAQSVRGSNRKRCLVEPVIHGAGATRQTGVSYLGNELASGEDAQLVGLCDEVGVSRLELRHGAH